MPPAASELVGGSEVGANTGEVNRGNREFLSPTLRLEMGHRETGRLRIPEIRPSIASSPEGADRVVVPRTGHFRQDGRVVQMFAIKKTAQLLAERQAERRDPGRRFHFVGHQANVRMLEAVCRQCDIASDRHHSNVEQYGNTAGAGAPSVLSMRWNDWMAEDDVAVVGVGAGLTWSSYLLRFEASA